MNVVSTPDEPDGEVDRLAREAIEWLERLHGKDEVVLEFVSWLLASPQHVQSFLIIGQTYDICTAEAADGDPTKLDQKKMVELVKARIRAFPELFGSALSAPSTFSESKVIFRAKMAGRKLS